MVGEVLHALLPHMSFLAMYIQIMNMAAEMEPMI